MPERERRESRVAAWSSHTAAGPRNRSTGIVKQQKRLFLNHPGCVCFSTVLVAFMSQPSWLHLVSAVLTAFGIVNKTRHAPRTSASSISPLSDTVFYLSGLKSLLIFKPLFSSSLLSTPSQTGITTKWCVMGWQCEKCLIALGVPDLSAGK